MKHGVTDTTGNTVNHDHREYITCVIISEEKVLVQAKA